MDSEIKRRNILIVILILIIVLLNMHNCSDKRTFDRTVKKLSKTTQHLDSLSQRQKTSIDSFKVVLNAKDFSIKKLEEEVSFYRDRMSKPVNNTVRFVLPDEARK
ncbi:MAG: hypothetical protein ACRDD8_11035 [Bacteroidales bacterium]